MVRAMLTLTAMLILTNCSDSGPPKYQPTYSETPPANSTVYIFSPHPMLNPQKLAEIYGAIIDQLNEHLAADHITLKLEVSRNYADFEEKLQHRQMHFALPNPYETVLAQDWGYMIFGKMDSQFQGVILMRKDSPITNVQGLKGSTVSFAAFTALAGTMMPELFLQEHGVNPKVDITQAFVGTHDSAIMNVFIGNAVAACSSLRAWQVFQHDHPDQAHLLEVRWRTDILPNNGLVARNDLPEDVQRKVAQAFFQLSEKPESQRILNAAGTSGFVPADNATYAPVYDFIKRYERTIRPLKESHE